MSSKFSQSPPIRKTPAYCKAVRPPPTIITWPPPQLTATIWFRGYTDDLRPLDISQAIDLQQRGSDPDEYDCAFPWNEFRVEFELFAANLLTSFSGVIRILDAGVGRADAQAWNIDTLPSPTFDTREQPCTVIVGTGDAGFRVML